jgi:Tol biopolymer transport system component
MHTVRPPARCTLTLAALLLAAAAGAQTPGKTDAMSGASPMAAPADGSRELPVRMIPKIPPAAEAYYAPDGQTLIAQVRDPDAQQSGDARIGSALTYIFTEDGKTFRRINDRGQDACSFFFPDGKRVIWTSTRDNMDLPLGNWSDPKDYPTGAELYTSDLYGKDIKRLTRNKWYDAEVTVSPNGEWIVWTRVIDGNADIWRMRADGTGEQQVTFTGDWEPGAPFYLPDNDTIIFQAWRASELGKVQPTPMTVFTIKADGTGLTQRTFDRDMTWGPGPAADGRHYIFTRIIDGNNHELFLGDLAGGPPRRLTWNPGFDGMKSFPRDGSKMVFVRMATRSGLRGLYSHVMDLSSLKLGPENYKGIPETPVPANAVLVTDFTERR